MHPQWCGPDELWESFVKQIYLSTVGTLPIERGGGPGVEDLVHQMTISEVKHAEISCW